MAERNQKPTPKRLRDARRRGEVVFSADVASAGVFIAVLVTLWAGGGTLIGALRELWLHATGDALLSRPQAYFPSLLRHAVLALFWVMAAVAGVAAVAGAAASFFQVGGLAAWERLRPDLNRLNPAEGLQRIFSTRNLVNFLKLVLKTLLLGVLMHAVVRGYIDVALRLGYATPQAIMLAAGHVVLVTFGWAALIYAAMAAIDYAHEHFEFMKQQRMSVEDLRRERKESEGDPVNQSRRRSAHFEAVYMSLEDRVRMSTAVIASARTAVALQYRGPDDLPHVLARGENDVAVRIREVAAGAAVPVEFDPALAGRLFDEVAVDQPIPRTLFAPVARVLRWTQAGA